MLNAIIVVITLIVVVILFIFAQNLFISKVPKKGKTETVIEISFTENSYIKYKCEHEEIPKQKSINNK